MIRLIAAPIPGIAALPLVGIGKAIKRNRMSQAATKWAWAQRLPAQEKLLLLAFAKHADAKNEAWPCAKQLASVTGISLRTIKQKVVSLRNRGLIFDTGKRVGATNQVIVYSVGKEVKNCTSLRGEVANTLSSGHTGEELHHGIGSKHRPKTAPIQAKKISRPALKKKLRLVVGGKA